MAELRNIQHSLSSGEKEKAELMASLSRLRDDLTRLKPLSDLSPELSTLSLPQHSAAADKFSTASQTDLSGDALPIGTRLAEMARTRLQYDEARKMLQSLQQRLADLDDKIAPGQTESDKVPSSPSPLAWSLVTTLLASAQDRLLLIQEKEQLLRELRCVAKSNRKSDMESVRANIARLERDLSQALERSNRTITDRLKLDEERQLLLHKMSQALRNVAQLEGQLRNLSASTLSMSSSSSLGSLSTSSRSHASSKVISFHRSGNAVETDADQRVPRRARCRRCCPLRTFTASRSTTPWRWASVRTTSTTTSSSTTTTTTTQLSSSTSSSSTTTTQLNSSFSSRSSSRSRSRRSTTATTASTASAPPASTWPTCTCASSGCWRSATTRCRWCTLPRPPNTRPSTPTSSRPTCSTASPSTLQVHHFRRPIAMPLLPHQNAFL